MALDGSDEAATGGSRASGAAIDEGRSPSQQQQQRPVMSVRVLAETNEGNRPHMEDVTCCLFDRSRPGGQAFLAVFDGHGGRQAAAYAKEHLWNNMKRQEGFNSEDHDQVEGAMREAFAVTQRGMEKVVSTWPRARYGLPSTSGTTASVAVLRGRVLYTAHLGDSGIVLGRRKSVAADDGTPSDCSGSGSTSTSSSSVSAGSGSAGNDDDDLASNAIEAVPLTVDHKPDSEAERTAIEGRGGKVRSGTRGVSRVVWRRKRPINGRTVLNMAHSELVVEEIPFLGVARSLGDLWSYNPDIGDYIVSCRPDVTHRTLTVDRDQFIVLASDGLWNVMSSDEVVSAIARHTMRPPTPPPLHSPERREERAVDDDDDNDGRQRAATADPAQLDDVCHVLIQDALHSWRERRQRADNISVIVAFFNPPLSSSSSNSSSAHSSSSCATSSSAPAHVTAAGRNVAACSESNGDSRTTTPILDEATDRELLPSDETVAGGVAAAGAAVSVAVNTTGLSPVHSTAATAAARPRSRMATAEAGSVSSSEESSSSGSSGSDQASVQSPPVLRRTGRVQADDAGAPTESPTVPAEAAMATAVAPVAMDTPSSEESTAVPPQQQRTTRSSTRRSGTAVARTPSGGSGGGAVATATTTSQSSPSPSPSSRRASKRKSTPSSAEGPGKRSSRSSVRSLTGELGVDASATPLQEDTVSSSGDDV
eukprot:scpid26278/ scgid14553/ Protein phosphatase 1D; Protein phosphatase 2C isoform delta; Protein phosphatase magnesium-dependent 1 delta; p53-induced protein phosphatase 1